MPERYCVLILPNATADLVRICSYVEQQSKQNAMAVAARLIEAIDSLDLLPHRYEVHEHRTDPTKSVRSMAVPPFIIYYRVNDAQQRVRVLSIRHGARRQPKRFQEPM
jgi:plasmid stabilization system protein ParE